MLFGTRESQPIKEDDEEEEVIGAEAVFDEVRGDEVHRSVLSELHGNPSREQSRHGDPRHAPCNRVRTAEATAAAMSQEIHDETYEDHASEQQPGPEGNLEGELGSLQCGPTGALATRA